VDLHAYRRRAGEHPDPGDHDDSQEGNQAPQQVDRPADPAGTLILHDRPRSPGGVNLRGLARMVARVRSWRGGRHLAIVSPGTGHGEPPADHARILRTVTTR